MNLVAASLFFAPDKRFRIRRPERCYEHDVIGRKSFDPRRRCHKEQMRLAYREQWWPWQWDNVIYLSPLVTFLGWWCPTCSLFKLADGLEGKTLNEEGVIA